ncbi:hypothetical protein [Shewanella colwelliana]|uniref:hypothetical protein n=1 Tax=Shewanella colwelliana TaxID=23 RepID=UPI0022AF95A1|nr:hypothetical protein [Shewanella colwelliana]MCZ4337671.1 hypothetical protein [Shewanella colwelliana]
MERSDKTGASALAAGGNTVASEIHSEDDLRALIKAIEANLSESGQKSDPDRLEYITLIRRELDLQNRQVLARPLHTKKLIIEEMSPIDHFNLLRTTGFYSSSHSSKRNTWISDSLVSNARSSLGALKKGISSARMLVSWYLHGDSEQGNKLVVKYRGPLDQGRRESYARAKSKLGQARLEGLLPEMEELAAFNMKDTFAQFLDEAAASGQEQKATTNQSSARAQFEELLAQRKHLWETMIKPNKNALEHIKGTPPSGDIDWL